MCYYLDSSSSVSSPPQTPHQDKHTLSPETTHYLPPAFIWQLIEGYSWCDLQPLGPRPRNPKNVEAVPLPHTPTHLVSTSLIRHTSLNLLGDLRGRDRRRGESPAWGKVTKNLQLQHTIEMFSSHQQTGGAAQVNSGQKQTTAGNMASRKALLPGSTMFNVTNWGVLIRRHWNGQTLSLLCCVTDISHKRGIDIILYKLLCLQHYYKQNDKTGQQNMHVGYSEFKSGNKLSFEGFYVPMEENI